MPNADLSLRLQSPLTRSQSSTQFVAEVLHVLRQVDVPRETLRKDFRRLFADSLRDEFGVDAQQYLHNGLQLLLDNVVDDSGRTVAEIVNTSTTHVQLVMVQGTKSPVSLSLNQQRVSQWISRSLAEPHFTAVAQHAAQPNPQDILFAIGATAECAPTLPWLSAGGVVAAVSRPNHVKWAELIRSARNSAGTLIVPVLSDVDVTLLTDEELAQQAGIDIMTDLDAVAGFLRAVVQQPHRKLIVGGYIYIGGAAHISVQAAQDSLMVLAQSLEPTAVLTWLATPTDQTPVPLSVLESAVEDYASRNSLTEVRDWLWQRLGYCLPPQISLFATAQQTLAIRDCASGVQGPNYVMAKRAQRWRAYLSAMNGMSVAYCVTPPARTHSVLDHTLLHATYRGAPRFGLRPFDVATTKMLSAMSLAYQVENPVAFDELDPTALHMKYAVHAGLWRLKYETDSVWVPATVRGALALVLPKKFG
jgi:hypothetical protein